MKTKVWQKLLKFVYIENHRLIRLNLWRANLPTSASKENVLLMNFHCNLDSAMVTKFCSDYFTWIHSYRKTGMFYLVSLYNFVFFLLIFFTFIFNERQIFFVIET